MGLEKVGLKVIFELTFTLGFSDIIIMVTNSKYMGHSA